MAGYWIVPPPVPMIEPVAVPEIMINGPGGIYYDNGMLMIPCYREEVVTEAPDAPPQRVVKVRIIRPAHPESLIQSIAMMAHCLMPLQPYSPPTSPSGPIGSGGARYHVVR